jgi:hypothetical protein
MRAEMLDYKIHKVNSGNYDLVILMLTVHNSKWF